MRFLNVFLLWLLRNGSFPIDSEEFFWSYVELGARIGTWNNFELSFYLRMRLDEGEVWGLNLDFFLKFFYPSFQLSSSSWFLSSRLSSRDEKYWCYYSCLIVSGLVFLWLLMEVES